MRKAGCDCDIGDNRDILVMTYRECRCRSGAVMNEC
jgi:hypothetical protein